jgi:alpha-tubulin suppressor-like RCC1 family protein
VTTDDQAYCWGENGGGQLGDGSTTDHAGPVAVAGGHRFRLLAAGFDHTCGVRIDGRVFCWGVNAEDQLGNGTYTGPELCVGLTPCSTRPVAVRGGLLFRQLGLGTAHTCGLTRDDFAYCWGDNVRGQLGDSTYSRRRLRPTLVAGSRRYRHVNAGYDHTCAVTTGYRAFCWGDGRHGELGNGKTYLSFWPRRVAGGLSFERVTAGFWYTCSETTTNRTYCWGRNYNGQLGDGTTTDRLTPVLVVGGIAFAQVSAGGYHTCARAPNGAPYCWGWNAHGQLGDGTTQDRLSPTAVAGPS